MDISNNYLAINKDSWNKRTEIHLESEFYDVERFLQGKSSLNSIELDLLGNVSGKSILHLQCHFGQDSLSLSRMGAQVTGVDFSDKAIEAAKNLAIKIDSSAAFVCCDVYETPQFVKEKFDIVFTSYGTIGWLPNLTRWAQVIAQSLKPGGMFVFAEFHPVVWMFSNDFKEIQYRYFKTDAIIETESGTYANKNAPITQQYVSWNHGLSEVISALLQQGLQLETFLEYDYSPYNCFNDMVLCEPGKYRLKTINDKLPMVYALKAIKK